MKIHCFLISFAIVKVLAFLPMRDYKRAVFHANRHLERASTTNVGLKPLVANIILGNSTIEEISLMLAVPEFVTYEYLEGDKCDQVFLQTEIIRSTFQPVPALDDNANFGNMVLSYLGFDIRSMTRTSRIEILRSSSLLPLLGTARRCTMKTATIGLLFAVLRGEAPDFDSMANVCRLVGLYISMRFPVRAIKSAEVDDNGTCELGDGTRFTRKYKIINDNYFEVTVFLPEVSKYLCNEQ